MTLALLDRLKADRARRLPHLGVARHLTDESFDWLPIDEFERLTPRQKEAYLRLLADQLQVEMPPIRAAA